MVSISIEVISTSIVFPFISIAGKDEISLAPAENLLVVPIIKLILKMLFSIKIFQL